MTARQATGPLHVYPTGDVVEHELTDDCVCGLRMATAWAGDRIVGLIAIHHSLDGRENDEPST